MFSAKKLLLIGFFVIVLTAIPLTLYFLQQQQEIRSRAQAASTLSFAPPSSQASPMQKAVDETFSIDLTVDPSTNLVSFVRLEIQYDSTKLATASADGILQPFEPNKAAFPSINEGPIYEDGKIMVTVSVGPDPTKAIQSLTKVGTLTFKALAPTDTPTLVTYGPQTQVLSIGSSDQASENVLSNSIPAAIAIAGDGGTTPTPNPSGEPTPTLEPTPIPTGEPTPTLEPTIANVPPVCTDFLADVASGSAPLLVNFTVSGNDSDGQITKINFNFGDGNVTSVTDNLNTSSVSTQTAYTYNTGGTFTASAVLSDNAGGMSGQSECTRVVTVDGPAPSPTPVASISATMTDTPTPTIENPGPGATVIGIGAFFTVLSIIGAILFFAL